jgi:hypothetical protein
MAEIGYGDELLCRDYTYAVFSETRHTTRCIPLAGFGQYPPSYRTSCFGVVCANGKRGISNVALHKDLAAPLIFEVDSDSVSRWKFPASGDPVELERIPHKKIETLINRHRDEWRPDRIFRAKALNDKMEAIQLDFFDLGLLPLVESLVKEKLDRLIRDSLSATISAYKKANKRKNPEPAELFRLVFRFIAAKILNDRGHEGNWSSDDPLLILKQVEDYYNTESENLPSPAIKNKIILDEAWESISTSLNFHNLSVDDLAFVYENTLITPETRKRFGVHSTPPRIAEYIVNKLPFEKLEQSQRRVFEPCSGHGIFLIASMRRMRELLPASMSPAQRHNYLKTRLVGMEQDAFAIEVSRLSLMLADYPNRNDWNLINDDVFSSDRWLKELRKSDCVLCNPPFEDFPEKVRVKYQDLKSVHQPLEILLRVLEHPPSMIGFVLPRALLTGAAYRKSHQMLAQNYGEIELMALPDRIFNHSYAESSLLMAWERKANEKSVQISCRTVTEGFRNKFIKKHLEPSAMIDRKSLTAIRPDDFSIWIPRLSRLWTYLADYHQLGKIIEAHRGIQYNIPLKGENRNRNLKRVFSDYNRVGFYPGIKTPSDSLGQFQIKHNVYLRIDPGLMFNKAYLRSWEKPKILANAATVSRGPWRLVAAYDPKGLYAYQRLHGIWPKVEKDMFPILSILNHPMANAFLFSNEGKIDNRITTIKKIPVPPMNDSDKIILSDKVRSIIRLLSGADEEFFNSTENQLLNEILEIDAQLLKLYDLPPKLERELLDTFEGYQRPVPFTFKGYYPEGLTAYIPLHRLISGEFEDARADRLLERLEPISDPIIHEVLEGLNSASLEEKD